MTHSTVITNPSEKVAEPQPEVGHMVPFWLLLAVFLTLIFLTVVTVAAAQVDLGNLNLYVAMAIAGTKASLVCLFFMHLLWDRPFNRMLFLGCLMFVVLFISAVLTDDSAYRHQVSNGEGDEMKKVYTPMGLPKP
jgi:cytochrome c oxidase subunit 4